MEAAPPPPKQHRRRLLSSLFSSESAHTAFLVSQSFASAYAPYLLLPPFLFFFFVSLFFFQSPAAAVAAPLLLLLPILAKLWWRPAPRIYLVDFAAFKPPHRYRLTTHQCAKVTREASRCSLRNMFFQLKVLLKSGLGDDVYGAPYLFKEEEASGGVPTLEDAHEETQMMMFGAVDQLLAKTGVAPSSIDILIVAVSMFSPSPSLASHVVSRYGLRHDIKSFNLSGMGCAAGLAAVDLARRLLALPNHRGQSALLVSTENTTLNFYPGDDRSMLVANCLFRCGGHALLLSNYAGGGGLIGASPPPKMELLETIRTTTAASDRAYQAIFTREDEAGIKGTALGVELMEVAAEAAAKTMARLAPGYMPLTELWRAAVTGVAEAADNAAAEDKGNRRRRRRLKYVADWRKAFEHVCLHPGGKAVVEGMGKKLGLSEAEVEASKMALQRFGNTSGSGIWYALAYLEAKERLKGGDKVLQLALGSGFKCNAAVWKVLRHLRRPSPPDFNPWSDCIDEYPVAVPDAIDASHPHFAFYNLMEQELRRLEHAHPSSNPTSSPSFPFDSLLQHLQHAESIKP